ARTGPLYSTDGGNTWSAMGGGPYLTGQSVIGVAAVGSTILAATFEVQATAQTATSGGASYGLYRSNNGGQRFNLVQAGHGPPAGPVTALVADPQNSSNCGTQQSCTFYASITSASNPSAAGVFVSRNSGQTWSPVFTSATVVSGVNPNILNGATNQMVAKLAAGPKRPGAVALARVAPPTRGSRRPRA